MKILSLQQSKELNNRKISAEIDRASEIQSVLAQYEKRLVEAESNFQNTLKSNRELWEKECVEFFKTRSAFEAEIRTLTIERSRLVEPLVEREKAVETKEKDLNEREEILVKSEERLKEDQEALVKKVNEVFESDKSLQERRKRLTLQEQGCDNQKASIGAQAKHLSESLELFRQNSIKKESDFALQEAEIKGKQIALAERLKIAEAAEKENKAERVRLADLYATLERSKKEIYSKQNAIKHKPIGSN